MTFKWGEEKIGDFVQNNWFQFKKFVIFGRHKRTTPKRIIAIICKLASIVSKRSI